MDKGRRLHNIDTDMTNKFIVGLPTQLVFFVHAGRISTLREALQSAKISEEHGHQQSPGPSTVVPPVSSSTMVNAASDSVQRQLGQIT